MESKRTLPWTVEMHYREKVPLTRNRIPNAIFNGLVS